MNLAHWRAEAKQRWQALRNRYQALERRQQALAAACLLLVPYLLINLWLLDPALSRQRTLSRQVAEQQGEVARLTGLLQTLEIQIAQDPSAPQKAQLEQLRAEIRQTDQQLHSVHDHLLPPGEVIGFLENLLVRAPSLRLLSLKTQAPVSILPPLTDKEGKPQPRQFDLYQHGVEIRLEGRYADLYHYLEQLEQSQGKVLWGACQLSVGTYPLSTLTLTVHTLSSEKTWLSL